MTARAAAPPTVPAQDLFDPSLTVAKLRQFCIKIIRNDEILAQENPIVRPPRAAPAPAPAPARGSSPPSSQPVC